jgi:hypothetical protein
MIISRRSKGDFQELPRQKHEEFVQQLGLVDLQHTHFDGAGKLYR